MIVILMAFHDHTLQTAIDHVGELCRMTIESFQRNRAAIPSWGPEIDNMVERYVQGLEAWIVGCARPFSSPRWISLADVRSTYLARCTGAS